MSGTVGAENPEARASRSREQCFLIAYIWQLAAFNTHIASPTEDEQAAEIENRLAMEASHQASQEGIEPNMRSNISVVQGTTRYDNFVSVMTRSPSQLISKLVTDTGLQQLFNLSPAQMGALMPKMRIYKMLYQSESDAHGVPIEFTFAHSMTGADVNDIVSTRRGRGAGVGIKSFSWELLGTNTAEVDNNIKATLKIYFQNFKDFVRPEILQGSGEEDFHLDDYLSSKSANYLDLIFRSQKFRDEVRNGASREFNEKYYRIKSVLGWSVDQHFVGGNEDTIAPGKLFSPNLANKIRQIGTVLLLSLLEHSIDFREDGTVELTLNYHAAVESMMNSRTTNVLYAPAEDQEEMDDIDDLIRLYDTEVAELSAAESADEAPTEDPGVESEAGECETSGGNTRTKDEMETRLTELNTRRRELKASIYQRFITSIIDAGRMFYVDVPEPVFLEEGGISEFVNTDNNLYLNLDPQQEPAPTDDDGGGIFGALGDFRDAVVSHYQEEESSDEAADQVGGEGWGASRIPVASNEGALERARDEGPAPEGGASGAGEGGDEGGGVLGWLGGVAESAIRAVTPIGVENAVAQALDSAPTRRVYYMYLGDLIDLGLETLNRPVNQHLSTIKFLIGTLSVPSMSNTPGNENSSTVVNLADVPISMHLFMQFFNDRVVDTGRSMWPVREYIRDILSRLVFPALGAECRDLGGRGRRRADIDIIQISAYGDREGNDRVQPGGSNPEAAPAGEGSSLWAAPVPPGASGDGVPADDGPPPPAPSPSGGRIYDHQIGSVTSLDANKGRIGLADRNLFHYVIIQAGDFNEFRRDGTDPDAPNRDAADGIYWLNIGNEGGLVKSIKFKKTDQPMLPESRQEQEGTIALGQLREKYDADVSMFGNNLFQPGQMIYINPTVVGLAGPRFATRLSSVLGIGGYHQIITVDNTISDNNYETILNTKWVASGNPANFQSESEELDCPASDQIAEIEARVRGRVPIQAAAGEELTRIERETAAWNEYRNTINEEISFEDFIDAAIDEGMFDNQDEEAVAILEAHGLVVSGEEITLAQEPPADSPAPDPPPIPPEEDPGQPSGSPPATN